MSAAEPPNGERESIIRMVHLASLVAADLARRFDELAAFEVDLGVGSAVHFDALLGRQRGASTELAHPLSVTL